MKIKMFWNKYFAYGGKGSYVQFAQSQSCFLLVECAEAPLWKTRPFRLWIAHLNKVTSMILKLRSRAQNEHPRKAEVMQRREPPPTPREVFRISL